MRKGARAGGESEGVRGKRSYLVGKDQGHGCGKGWLRYTSGELN